MNPLYVAARRVLLDALDALDRHRDAVVLVGAQAIYLQAGKSDLDASVAPYTADADLGIDPEKLGPDPHIDEAMRSAGFHLKVKSGNGGEEPGTWLATATVGDREVSVPVDLLVPESMAPLRGSRDARLPEHGKNATRWTPGIEATVRDNTEMTVVSLEPDVDDRSAQVRVAGPGALLVAKAHKLAERLGDGDRGQIRRVKPKDAGDVYRLMTSSTSPVQVGSGLRELADDPLCGQSVSAGVKHLSQLFGAPNARGVTLAAEALRAAEPEERVRRLAPAYVTALVGAYNA
ncbi:hypothetical protein [Phytohabitans suffuscus]|uniref:Nucleotidyltransferase n=1 Tax=Phytohabitans suffuscus TaxID=624315 RepID=A0A6F8YFN7_9ACTN|nr:hypothetical protein [Phytohabitans suffuscus]BCB84954.1 hypothetical protein Psuf_022670 [Phytohabitans suffuscus]